MHQSVSFPELLALYAVSNVCVVASTRDGMNLVSFEYIACQRQRHGSMILSEFAGSAQSLTGSIIVNPWNVHEMARAMYHAYGMGEEERKERYEKMEGYVEKFTRFVWQNTPDRAHFIKLSYILFANRTALLTPICSTFWGKSFVDALTKIGKEPVMEERLWMNPKERNIDWHGYDGGMDR